jgi:2-oxoglutarate dehydrogenase E1 component
MGQQELDFLASLPESMIDELHLRWQQGEQLSQDWQHFFEGYQLGQEAGGGSAECCYNPVMALKHSGVQSLIYRYRDLGHLLACTDPLAPCPMSHPLLDLAAFGLDEHDLQTVFTTRRHHLQQATLQQFVSVLQETYCRKIGVEFMYMQDPDERQWLIDRMEPCLNRPQLSLNDKLLIMGKLHEAVLFESFLHRKFPGQKRFSLEGGEILIPVLESMLQASSQAGVTDLVMGMSHRGRLNVLATIFGKPYQNIFAEFRDAMATGFVGDGDVKYHKGYSADRMLDNGMVHLTLASNPSHLEAVDPVVEGKSRARQDRIGTAGEQRVLPILIHGDAAFAGQGLVAEVLNMSRLEGYRTGGTIHIVVNNQIGFTTRPKDARSTRYATDVAKMLACPIFHIHGEAPEAAVHATRLALEYRQVYAKDVVIELICYRRHGHNEGDEPAFTLPVMYRAIAGRPTINLLYSAQLLEEGIAQSQLDGMATQVSERLDAVLTTEPHPRSIGFKDQWQDVEREYSPFEGATGVSISSLQQLSESCSKLPDGFVLHPKLTALLRKREESVQSGTGIEWGAAEILAYASLLAEGHAVRLSGQDSRRGTFNHRHAVLYDSNSGESYTPLAVVAAAAGSSFQVYDSLLSESGVLGFEYGYSLETPNSLTIWEAQFGDFANGAQVIFDQFISSGETKWNRASGLVLFLPHGYEGQGGEHSSARIERYLQLCAKNNLIVVQPSTPAQFFHLLRRQLKQPFRKPLVVFTPKSLLRNHMCSSSLEEFAEGSRFQDFLLQGDLAKARRVLLCSGRIYFDLARMVSDAGRDDIALIRFEQLYPFRKDILLGMLQQLPQDSEILWVQDEPENMGAWGFLQRHLSDMGVTVQFVGREEDSCPAVGSHQQHEEQLHAILSKACS